MYQGVSNIVENIGVEPLTSTLPVKRSSIFRLGSIIPQFPQLRRLKCSVKLNLFYVYTINSNDNPINTYNVKEVQLEKFIFTMLASILLSSESIPFKKVYQVFQVIIMGFALIVYTAAKLFYFKSIVLLGTDNFIIK
jgi:hypothetical protein